MKKKSFWCGKLLVLVFDALFLMGAIWFSIMPYQIFKTIITGHKTLWVVTSVIDVWDESEAYSISAIYDCWSIIWIEWNSIWESSTYHYNIGEEIILYCDEKNPWEFVLNTYVDYLSLIPPFILRILIIVVIKGELYKLRIQKFKQNSMKVNAVVDEIVPGKAKYSKLYWCTIKAKYSGNIYLSEFVNWDVEKVVKVWDKIDLYISYDDPTKYWVDIDKISREIDELGSFGEKYDDSDENNEFDENNEEDID